MKGITISISCGVLLVCFFSTLITFSILRRFNENEDNKLVEMRFLQLDSLNKEVSRGFVTIPGGYSESYNTKDETGKYTLISEFGSEEYQCEGSCWCEEFETERRSSSPATSLKRPLFVLLSALTFSLGIEKASEYFEEKCELDYSSSCSELSQIRSEVHSCDKIFTDDQSSFVEGTVMVDEEKKIGSLDSTTTSQTQNKLSEEWVCDGFCLDNGHITDTNGLKAQKEINCESLRTKKEYSFDPDEFRELGVHSWNFFASKFLSSELTEFCKENSIREFETVSGVKNMKRRNLCVGSGQFGRKTNVNCKRRVSEFRKFHCKGNCLVSGLLKSTVTRQMAEDFGCEDLKMERELEITVEEMKQRKLTNIHFNFNNFAKNKFQTLHLKDFCKKESKRKYYWESKSGKDKRWTTINLCLSRSTKLYPSDVFNGSIKCLQTFPRPESAD